MTTSPIAKVLTNVHEYFWQKWRWNSGSPKKMIKYSTWKSVNEGFYLLDLENWLFWLWRPNGSMSKFLVEVHENFGKNDVVILDHQKPMDHSTWKITKMGGLLLQNLFDLKNGRFWPLGSTGLISKVLTDVYKFFLTIMTANSGSPKIHGLAHKKSTK